MPGDYIDETHQRISEFADEFLDDDEERQGFIDGLLERRGYQQATHWTPPEPQGGQGGRQGLLKPKATPKSGGRQGGYFKGAGGK